MVNDSFIKKKSYYEDIFDLLTIEEALRIKNDSPSSDISYSDKFPTETIKAMRTTVNELLLFFYLGERVKKKKLYLERVMSEDKEKQQFYDSKFEPNHVLCPYCESPVHLIDKTLDDFSSSQLQVIFMYECIGCKKRSCFFPDGKLKTFPPDECSNCKSNDILEKSVQTPRKTTITSKCNSCGHISETIYDLDELEQSRAEREKYKNSLFMSYRSEFCLDENSKEYKSYIHSLSSLETMKKLTAEFEGNSHDPVIPLIKSISIKTVIQLEDIINKSIKNKGYDRLVLGVPVIDKDVIIQFTLYDVKGRPELESTYELKRIIKKALTDTNWRLMSEGITYNLGILSGRLRGYQGEKSIYELARQKYKKQTKSSFSAMQDQV